MSVVLRFNENSRKIHRLLDKSSRGQDHQAGPVVSINVFRLVEAFASKTTQFCGKNAREVLVILYSF